MYLDITLLIVSLFLLISLILGLLSGRGTNTFKKFAVGDKNFATRTLIATMVATDFGGGFLFRTLENVYAMGIYYILPTIVGAGSFFIVGQLMALRMGEFLNHFSIAESMGSLFGMPVRIITAISGILLSTGALAIQFQVIVKVIKLCTNIEGDYPIYISAIIVLVYSAFGGIKAVTFTDVIQFLTFGTLIPILLYICNRHINDCTPIRTILTTHENFHLRQVIGLHPKFIDAILLGLMALTPSLNPAMMQRFYMAKNVWQARSSFTYTSFISFLLKILVICLGISFLTKNSNLNPKELVNYLLATPSFFLLKSFICIGVLALSMSTADSFVNASSVLFTNDLIGNSKFVTNNKLLLSRLFSLLIGIFSLQLAFIEDDLFKLKMIALSFYTPIVLVPFIMAVFGFRPSSKSVLLGMGAGTLTIIAFKKGLGGYLGISNQVFPAMGMNLLFLMGSYYLLSKQPNTGWIGIKDKGPLMYENQEKERRRKARISAIKNFNLTTYLEKLIPQRTSTFVLLGIYILVTTYIQLWIKKYNTDILLYVMEMIGGTLSITYPAWKGNKTKDSLWVVYGYPLFIFSSLFLAGSYVLHMEHYHPIATLIFFTNIFVGTLLLSWGIVLAMSIIACGSVHCMVPGGSIDCNLIVQSWKNSAYYLTSLFLCLSMATVAFKKKYAQSVLQLKYIRKEQESKQTTQLKSNLYHHHLNRLTKNRQDEEDILPEIINNLDKFAQDNSVASNQKAIIQDTIDRLASYREFLEEKTYYEHIHLPLATISTDILPIIDNTIKHGKEVGILLRPIVDHQNGETRLICDPSKVEELLLSSLRFIQNSQVVPKDTIVYIYLGTTTIKYELNVAGESFKRLSALAIIITTEEEKPEIKEEYQELLDVVSPMILHAELDVYKKDMDYIVDAHYGCCFINKGIQSVTLSFILPLQLDAIRDKVMDAVHDNPYEPLLETPKSLAQEKSLINLLVEKTVLQRTFIQETIYFIKKCHGDQKRESGEPYYTHPMAVATLVLQETKDPSVVISALLHDVVEDSKVPLSYIKSRFGREVAMIVNNVTHMGDSFRKKRLTKRENESQLMECKDIRPIQVKLADRLHNVSTLKYRPREKQIAVAKQTLEFYIPFAEAMGITTLTKEIRERCKEILRG